MKRHNQWDDSGRGPAIVFLHGYPFDRSMWNDQIEFLSEHGYRCVAPDLIGGTSENVTEASVCNEAGGNHRRKSVPLKTMEEMAREVAALMEELGIGQAVVCGLSMGGYVAFDFARLFPGKVRGLVLAGTRASADTEPEKQARGQQVELMLDQGMQPVADASLPKLLSLRTLNEKPEVAERVRQMILKSDPVATAAAQRGMAARRDYVDELADITAPTLIIVGRDDRIRPVADAEFMHERISNSRLEIIENAAHMTNMEQAEQFNRALLEWLGTV